jgi:hypothetical protein
MDVGVGFGSKYIATIEPTYPRCGEIRGKGDKVMS